MNFSFSSNINNFVTLDSPDDLNQYIISNVEKAKNVLVLLDKSADKILFVVNENKETFGSVTAGDIRRGIIKGFSLEDSIEKFCNKDFYYVNNLTTIDFVIGRLIYMKLIAIPSLGSNREIQSLVIRRTHRVQEIENPVVIMAGGRGSRLGDLTKDIPKPLLNYKNETILENIISLFKNDGFINFVLTVGYLKEKIINFFGSGKDFGVKIDYIIEDSPMGTAGSIFNLKEKKLIKANQPFIVANGDLIIEFSPYEMLEYHTRNKADLTFASKLTFNKSKYGVIEYSNGSNVKQIIEKPSYPEKIFAGVTIINSELVWNQRVESNLDMTDFINQKCESMKVIDYDISGNWLDLGSKENFELKNG